jgi:hypothetical protein
MQRGAHSADLFLQRGAHSADLFLQRGVHLSAEILYFCRKCAHFSAISAESAEICRKCAPLCRNLQKVNLHFCRNLQKGVHLSLQKYKISAERNLQISAERCTPFCRNLQIYFYIKCAPLCRNIRFLHKSYISAISAERCTLYAESVHLSAEI